MKKLIPMGLMFLMVMTPVFAREYVGNACVNKQLVCPSNFDHCEVELLWNNYKLVGWKISSGEAMDVAFCPSWMMRLEVYGIGGTPTTTTTSTTTTITTTVPTTTTTVSGPCVPRQRCVGGWSYYEDENCVKHDMEKCPIGCMNSVRCWPLEWASNSWRRSGGWRWR